MRKWIQHLLLAKLNYRSSYYLFQYWINVPGPHTTFYCTVELLNIQTLQTFPHLHVDLLKTRNEVADLTESESTHPRWSSYTNQEHPFLLSVLELLIHKVDLRHGKKDRHIVAWAVCVCGGSMWWWLEATNNEKYQTTCSWTFSSLVVLHAWEANELSKWVWIWWSGGIVNSQP